MTDWSDRIPLREVPLRVDVARTDDAELPEPTAPELAPSGKTGDE